MSQDIHDNVDLDSFNVTTGPRQWGSVNETFIENGVLTSKIEQVRDPYLDLRFSYGNVKC